MSDTDLSKTPFSASGLDLSPPPSYAGLAPHLLKQLTPESQKLMAPFLHKTTMAGSSTSTHPAVSALHPEKGRPIQLQRFTTSSFLPKNFEKQQQLITISSEESDDDDDVQIDSHLSTAPRIITDVNALLAKQRGMLTQTNEPPRIPLPQQQLHSNLSGVRPFMMPGGVNRELEYVYIYISNQKIFLSNTCCCSINTQYKFKADEMARLHKYNVGLEATSAVQQTPAQPTAFPTTQQLINASLANTDINNGEGVNVNNITGPGTNQFRDLFPQHNFDKLFPKSPPALNNSVNATPNTGAQPPSNDKPDLASHVIDID